MELEYDIAGVEPLFTAVRKAYEQGVLEALAGLVLPAASARQELEPLMDGLMPADHRFLYEAYLAGRRRTPGPGLRRMRRRGPLPLEEEDWMR